MFKTGDELKEKIVRELAMCKPEVLCDVYSLLFKEKIYLVGVAPVSKLTVFEIAESKKGVKIEIDKFDEKSSFDGNTPPSRDCIYYKIMLQQPTIYTDMVGRLEYTDFDMPISPVGTVHYYNTLSDKGYSVVNCIYRYLKTIPELDGMQYDIKIISKTEYSMTNLHNVDDIKEGHIKMMPKNDSDVKAKIENEHVYDVKFKETPDEKSDVKTIKPGMSYILVKDGETQIIADKFFNNTGRYNNIGSVYPITDEYLREWVNTGLPNGDRLPESDRITFTIISEDDFNKLIVGSTIKSTDDKINPYMIIHIKGAQSDTDDMKIGDIIYVEDNSGEYRRGQYVMLLCNGETPVSRGQYPTITDMLDKDNEGYDCLPNLKDRPYFLPYKFS